jgi:hypothetical protein
MSDQQSTFKFLISREGRGILIGTIVVVGIVSLIGVFTFNSLFGSNDPRPNRPAAGENAPRAGTTEIKPSSAEIRPNVTSEGLGTEARGLLDNYNDQAGELGVMPVPTPENVELVKVAPQVETDNVEMPLNIDGARNSSGQYPSEFDAQSQRQALQDERERAKAAEQARREYQRSRLDAASELLAVYSVPPSDASFAITALDSSAQSGQSASEPARVSRTGDGGTQFVGSSSSGVDKGQCKVPLIKGGEFRYAQTDIALNTDFEGPVRMTFLDGPIAGYIGMGEFELNELGAKMKLRITTLFDPSGQRYQVSGYVLDPETTLWAMASNVDRHIIYRYGGFGLGTILSSFAILADNRATESEIITPEGGQSKVTRDPDGKQVVWTLLGGFGRLFETAFKDNLNRPATVTLDPQQEAAVLFEDTVCELDTQVTRDRKAAAERIQSGFSDPVRG